VNDRVKRGLAACFGGGAITFLCAVWMFPSLGYLGACLAALIGAVVGYFGADFPELIRAIPNAARVAWPVAGRGFRAACGKTRWFFSESRPFFWMACLWAVIGSSFLLLLVDRPQGSIVGALSATSLGALCGFIVCCRCIDMFSDFALRRDSEKAFELLGRYPDFLAKRVCDDSVILYGKSMLMMPGGLAYTVLKMAVIQTARSALAILLMVFVRIPCGVVPFIKHLFREIHSDIRLMCMVDGPLGGIAGFALLWAISGTNPANLPGALVLLSALGAGVISLALGYANYRAIAIWWLGTMSPVVVKDD